MYRGSKTTRAIENVRSLELHKQRDEGVTDGINNARLNISKRVHSQERPIDMNYARRLYEFYFTDPVVKRTEAFIISKLFQERPVYSANDQRLQMTTEFINVVDNHIVPFCHNAHIAYRCLGFVPVHYVIIPAGYVVPRVLDPETYEISVYYDYLAEAQCYNVYRRTEGAFQQFNVKTISTWFGDTSTQEESSLKDVIAALEGRDPRETASMRIDLGKKYPKDGEVDSTVYIYDAFQNRPSLSGQLRSDIHAIYIRYMEMTAMKKLYFESLRAHMSQIPLVQSEPINEEALNRDVGMSMNEDPLERLNIQARDRYATTQIDIARINELQREERLRRAEETLRQFETEEITYEHQLDPGFGRAVRKTLREYDASAPAFDYGAKKKQYTRPLLPGEKVASYQHAQTAFGHLPLFLEDYKLEVGNILGASPVNFAMNRGNQDQTALHLSNDLRKRHALVTMYGRMVTDTHSKIYAPAEAAWYAHVYFNEHLREEVIRSMAQDFKLYYTQAKKYDTRLYRLLEREAENIQEVTLAQLEARYGKDIKRGQKWFSDGAIAKRPKQSATSSGEQRGARSDASVPYKDMLQEGKMLESEALISKEERAWDRMYHQPQILESFRSQGAIVAKTLKDPSLALQELQTHETTGDIERARNLLQQVQTIKEQHELERKYEDALLDDEIRAAMFLGTLHQLSTDTIFSLYSVGGESQRIWLRKMFHNWTQVKEKMRVTISFTSAANINLQDLLQRVALGFVSKKEAYDIVRTQMFMPIDADSWTDSKNMDLVLKAVQESLVDTMLAGFNVGRKRSAEPPSKTNGDSGSPSAAANSAGQSSSSDSKRRKRADVVDNASSEASRKTESRNADEKASKVEQNATS